MEGFLSPIGAVFAAVPGIATAPSTLAALAALGVLLAAWGATALRQPSLVAERLGTFNNSARSLEDLELQRSFTDRVLQPLIRKCSGLVLRYTPKSTLDGYRRKLILAGSPAGAEVRDFLGVKGLLALGFAGAWLLLGGAAQIGPSPISVAVVLGILGFYLPNMMLSRRIKKRQNEIQRALPDTLDLLTICVEAGLGFDAAIGRVVEKRHDELSRECGRVLTEMRMGRSRREALKTLSERTDVTDVNTFVSAIIQSEQLGVSISRVLLTQADQMRVRRRQRAEELAHKAPIKMLFPMVFLIFPAIFVVILGPAIPGIMESLSP
jgi:tight adherence protein C